MLSSWLELTGEHLLDNARYKKIITNHEAIENFFVDRFLDAHKKARKRIILDLDATDDPVHGNQEGRFFHGYYGQYCYMPLYIFCGDFLLGAKLRIADIDGAAGSVGELKRIVARIRQRWPKVEIAIRGDSGFARDDIMSWCEDNKVKYVLGRLGTGKEQSPHVRHRKRDGQSPPTLRSQRQGGACIQELRLPNA